MSIGPGAPTPARRRASGSIPRPLGFRFVETKLRPPRLREDVVPRQRLLEHVQSSITNFPLTLIAAPAGYGKTTLLAATAERAVDFDVAWVSVDEDDNDPSVFAAALVAALRRADPGVGSEAQQLLSEATGLARVILDSVMNDVIRRAKPLVLVLDDFHRVTEASITRGLEYLIDRMPPQMHLVVATRHDPQLPLPRLRVRHQVSEIHLGELRFEQTEAADFLNGVLGLDLTPEQVAVLHQRTEGWPAGISLLVAALRRLPGGMNRETFLAHLAQLDRYVFDFLAAEVLNALNEQDRRFLLDCSVLTELSPAMCAAVSGRDDAAAALQDLYARNLFVVALDQPPTLFRFHDLFRDFLRHTVEREDPNYLRGLHLRAGRAEKVFSRVIAHFLAAEAWDDAAAAIEHRGEGILREGALKTVKGWIHALPTPVLDAHPRLHHLLGYAEWTIFNLDASMQHFSRAVDGFRATGDRARLGAALVSLSSTYGAAGDFEKANALAAEIDFDALPLSPRLGLLMQETWFDMAAGKRERASEAFDAALDLIEAENDPELLHSFGRAIHYQLMGLPGSTRQIERFVRLAMPHARGTVTALRSTMLTVQSWAHQWRGRSEQALTTAAEAMSVADRLGGVLSVRIGAGLLQAILAALRGDTRLSDTTFDAIFEDLGRPEARLFVDAWLAGYLVALGRIRVVQGRLDEARAVEQRIRLIENLREWPIAPTARVFLRGLLEAADGRDDDAEVSFREAVSLQQKMRIDYFAGDARASLAVILLRNGRVDEALRIVTPFLDEHDRYRTPGAVAWEGPPIRPLLNLARERRVHAELATSVLRLMGDPIADAPGAVVSPSGEALSPRETEVLRLIADGASNAAIAEKLVISVHTVKRHVANVLQKLSVSSRSEAGAVARRMKIE